MVGMPNITTTKRTFTIELHGSRVFTRMNLAKLVNRRQFRARVSQPKGAVRNGCAETVRLPAPARPMRCLDIGRTSRSPTIPATPSDMSARAWDLRLLRTVKRRLGRGQAHDHEGGGQSYPILLHVLLFLPLMRLTVHAWLPTRSLRSARTDIRGYAACRS
jgi:hypothetical protein